MKRFFGWLQPVRKEIRPNPAALQKRALRLSFDFENYYSRIADLTFRSEIFPISPATAQAIVHQYQARFNGKYGAFTDDERVLLEQLEKDIEIHMAVFKGGAVFVRMSDRSPKDGAPLLASGETVSSCFEKALASCSPDDANAKMVALSELQLRLLRCETPKQVMNLLLTSERVFIDLLLALDCFHATQEDLWSTCIILREWNDQLRGDLEFRVFVCDRKITAISQYNHYCQFDSLCFEMDDAAREALRRQIVTYVTALQPRIDEHSYVVDVALIEHQLFVIELNPFQTTTGGALFDWEGDDAILHGRTDSALPEFRIRTRVMDRLDEMVDELLRETSLPIPSGPYEQQTIRRSLGHS